uniref:Exonuclease domain-containing protein n=1 Tax=Kalanchoe fedtschenkoi TaxID=63787 RepID=A0A7N0V0B2_KALFE
MDPSNSGQEIVFFDLETTVPRRCGQQIWVLEFGAVVVCPLKLLELESYTTLIRPPDLSVVPFRSNRGEGITRELMKNAPSFDQVADKIFSIMNGRVWAGHNIQRFDSHRLNDAFRHAGRPAPVCAGMIDSLGVLTNKFGRRAGDMKMATLATYFGLGQQKHRSLDDVRMNLEVLKHCATVLFLESSLPNVLNANWQTPPTMMTRSRTNTMFQNKEEGSRKSPPSSSMAVQRPVPYAMGNLGKVTRGVKSLLSKASENGTLSNILKHSHSIIR